MFTTKEHQDIQVIVLEAELIQTVWSRSNTLDHKYWLTFCGMPIFELLCIKDVCGFNTIPYPQGLALCDPRYHIKSPDAHGVLLVYIMWPLFFRSHTTPGKWLQMVIFSCKIWRIKQSVLTDKKSCLMIHDLLVVRFECTMYNVSVWIKSCDFSVSYDHKFADNMSDKKTSLLLVTTPCEKCSMIIVFISLISSVSVFFHNPK